MRVSLLKRLDKLDAPLRAKRNQALFCLALHHGIPMAPGTASRAQSTVLSWPPIATDLDAWNREASAQQDALIAASAEDRVQPAEPVVTDSSDPHIENERAYQQNRADQIQSLKDYRDARASQVTR